MRKLLISYVSVLILSVSGFAQNETKPCPTIQIIAPATITSPGDSMTFSAQIEDKAENLKLRYNWIISSGVIVDGQNTSTIKVATTLEMSGEKVTAKVTVQGLPENCAAIASEWGIVMREIYDLELDSYGKISSREEKGRLDNLFVALANNPKGKALIKLSLTKNENIGQAKNHIKQIMKHIIFRKQPKEQFIFAIEQSNVYKTTLQIIVENQEFPEYESCEILKGEDVK